MWNGILFFSSRFMQVFVRILIQNVAWHKICRISREIIRKLFWFEFWIVMQTKMEEKAFISFFGFVFAFWLELRSSKIGFTFTWNPILYLVVCSICKNFNNVEHPGNWMIAMWRISAFRIILMWQQWKPRLVVYLLFEKKRREKDIRSLYLSP